MADVKKVTKRDYFEGLKVIVEASGADNAVELLEFIDKELELLAKRNATRTKTKKQVENERLAEEMYEVMKARGEALDINAIKELDEEFADFNPQKVSAILKKLVDAGRVTKTYDKKHAYYLAV